MTAISASVSETAACNPGVKRNIGLCDVIYVHVIEGKTVAEPKDADDASAAVVGARAELRVRPTVQGAELVLENKTGRILAMAGSSSYFASQLNRTSQTQRQPRSAMKPLTYLTALQAGLQPRQWRWQAPFAWHDRNRRACCITDLRADPAIWALEIAPKAPLNGPSPEAKHYLVDLPIDYMDGQP